MYNIFFLSVFLTLRHTAKHAKFEFQRTKNIPARNVLAGKIIPEISIFTNKLIRQKYKNSEIFCN